MAPTLHVSTSSTLAHYVDVTWYCVCVKGHAYAIMHGTEDSAKKSSYRAAVELTVVAQEQRPFAHINGQLAIVLVH
jgi:hypothetical protein